MQYLHPATIPREPLINNVLYEPRDLFPRKGVFHDDPSWKAGHRGTGGPWPSSVSEMALAIGGSRNIAPLPNSPTGG